MYTCDIVVGDIGNISQPQCPTKEQKMKKRKPLVTCTLHAKL